MVRMRIIMEGSGGVQESFDTERSVANECGYDKILRVTAIRLSSTYVW